MLPAKFRHCSGPEYAPAHIPGGAVHFGPIRHFALKISAQIQKDPWQRILMFRLSDTMTEGVIAARHKKLETRLKGELGRGRNRQGDHGTGKL